MTPTEFEPGRVGVIVPGASNGTQECVKPIPRGCGKIEATSGEAHGGRPLRFLRVAVTTARCSAIGELHYIPGVLDSVHASLVPTRPARSRHRVPPRRNRCAIVYARLAFHEELARAP